MLPLETSVDEVKRRLAAGEIVLLDCREPAEHATARIGESPLIPMREVPARLREIETMAEAADAVVVYCHHGVRSLNVAHWLRQQGVDNVQSMAGGIDHWSAVIDPAVPRY
jgi:rhodanese-related sulfurtransferase